jgi:hypothetical protein
MSKSDFLLLGFELITAVLRKMERTGAHITQRKEDKYTNYWLES